MVKRIRAVLSPLLIISYVCGLRIVEFPEEHPRMWLSCFYNLVLWFTYSFFMIDIMLSYIPHEWTQYRTSIILHILTGFLSLFIRLYYDKKFRNCLRKLAVVDETLEKLGTTTDFQKLNIKIAKFVAGWFAIVLILNFGDSFWWQNMYSVLITLYIVSLVNYFNHTTLLDDLTYVYILGYIGLKFDQVNELLHKVANNKFIDGRAKRSWKNTVVYSERRFPYTPSNEFIIWTVIHLHLELCKISHEINSVFGILITIKITSYFLFIAENFCELYYILFENNVINKWVSITMETLWILVYLCRLLLISYSCEKVSNKANGTKDCVNKVIYSTRITEIRENIVQLLLQIIRAPLRFYGFGYFQFGFKYFYRYCMNIVTLLVIIIQANQNQYPFLQN